MRSAPVAAAVGLALCAAGARAGDLRPLPAKAPQQSVLAGLRVHLVADEDLEPDALRALARPGVVLWLRTRSNTLRESTLDTARQFDAAWLALRPPLDARALAQLVRAPEAGIWLRLSSGGPPVPAVRPGPLRLAVSWQGPLDEAAAQAIARLSPALVEWRPEASADLLSWSLFKNLPGKLLFRPAADALHPTDCGQGQGRQVAVAVHVASLLSLGTDAFPCGRGARVRVSLDTEPWVLQSVHVRDPAAELELEVGADAAQVGRARRLLDAIGLGPRP